MRRFRFQRKFGTSEKFKELKTRFQKTFSKSDFSRKNKDEREEQNDEREEYKQEDELKD